MSSKEDFSNIFSEENLREIYSNIVSLTPASGIDNISQSKFWINLDQHIETASRKTIAGNYNFTKYKLKLISKGRGKSPREISIPTIRDRVVLRALCDLLSKIFSTDVNISLPQYIIKKVKEELYSGSYDGFIKLDVSNFYPSINHDELLQRVRARIVDDNALTLIRSALETPTVIRPSKTDKLSTVGVPQGLSISNILSAIYLIDIDKRYSDISDIKYYRYVDDVLILCKYSSVATLANDITSCYSNIGLKIHPFDLEESKSKYGRIEEDSLSYLGYDFDGEVVTPRSASVDKLRNSILSIFSGYKHSENKNVGFLEWRLNLRITGCIFENKCKGWLFYFSEINDEKLLHRLDHFVTKMSKKYGVDVNVKKFVRSFYQIVHNKYESKYIPNFDTYTIDDMKNLIIKYFEKPIERYTDEEIEYEFKRRISKQVRDIESDVMDFKS